ncbi:mannitol dehydrogenase family protein [Actinoplanes bogorensis]|uniref:Mannitol dehydrogenase family protein n=1 Tax=Paractinoplanes bogorensis TaxID=1610840 RepID=A0ABS5YKS7_9ACTN|nr:mannitol dehydrogenase family protein [Actinoplanes bogorensis]MBU2664074.1 mannitol dehydrogenase family protein [Actinoplanes bogorensis]
MTRQPRIVHFGLGNFHRAHQAVYTQAVGDWGIAGVAPSSRATVAKLRAQDCLYSVTTRGPGAPVVRVCDALAEALHLGDDADRVQELVAAPGTTVVTLTITEKGYFRTPDGHLDTAAPEIAADLVAGTAHTVIGALVRGLTVRHLTGGAPLTVISCDNMAANGAVLAGVVREFAALAKAGDAFLSWLDESVAWPSTVVDRIVPALAPGDVEAASAVLPFRDEVPVAAEPYRLWVLEDAFAADRPRWELDGALIVPDVTPYQLTKLRLLNGSHSALAYLGRAAGLETVADTMATDWGPKLVRQLADEVAPTLPTFGPNPAQYADDLVTRFENPAIRHSLRQISSDGSGKLPERWFGVLRSTRSPILELALAGWVAQTGDALDPLADRLARNWAEHRTAPELVAAQLRLVGASDLADRPELVRSVAERLPAVLDGRIEV